MSMHIYISYIYVWLYVYMCGFIYRHSLNREQNSLTEILPEPFLNLYVYMYVYMYVCIYIYIYMYVFMYIYISINKYIYIYINIVPKGSRIRSQKFYLNHSYIIYMHMYISYIYLYTCGCIYMHWSIYRHDDDVYLIEKLQHVGYKICLLTDQPIRHKYKMNSKQQ
jgi:hypothetical protein